MPTLNIETIDSIAEPSETVRLFGCGTTWQDVESPVRALLFGQMVARAIPVTKQYLSDLYHDAQWIERYVQGPTEFLWMVRECGTNLGDSAQVQEYISGREPRVLYHVALTASDRGWWSATFTTLVKVEKTER